MANVNWDFLYRHVDVNVACQKFYTKLNKIFEQCVEKSSETRKHKNSHWFSMEYQRSGNLHIYNAFQSVRSLLNQNISSSRASYILRIRLT